MSSLTGLLLTANRARLRPNIIRALIAVGSWGKESIIDIVDRELKRSQKYVLFGFTGLFGPWAIDSYKPGVTSGVF